MSVSVCVCVFIVLPLDDFLNRSHFVRVYVRTYIFHDYANEDLCEKIEIFVFPKVVNMLTARMNARALQKVLWC